MASKQTQFQESIQSVSHELTRKSIDYRVIGSVAAEALGILPVSFEERDAVDAIDRVPDIDVIVPRDQLDGAREVRRKIAGSSFPIKVGLAVPSMQVDLRPDQAESYLTWGKDKMPISTSVFDPLEVDFQGIPVRAVSAETLRHFYGQMSPQRAGADQKYVRKLAHFDAALGHDEPHSDEDPLAIFHEYNALINAKNPISRRSMEMFYTLTKHMTAEQRNRMRHIAFRMADVAGWR